MSGNFFTLVTLLLIVFLKVTECVYQISENSMHIFYGIVTDL